MIVCRIKPFLLKPNEEVLQSWYNVEELSDREGYIHYAERLIADGAKNVLLSLGGEGGIFLNKDIVYSGNSLKVK